MNGRAALVQVPRSSGGPQCSVRALYLVRERVSSAVGAGIMGCRLVMKNVLLAHRCLCFFQGFSADSSLECVEILRAHLRSANVAGS